MQKFSTRNGFDTSAWFALPVPKATPDTVRTEIERAVIAVLTVPDTRNQLRAAGFEIAAKGSSELQKRIGDDTRMWRSVISNQTELINVSRKSRGVGDGKHRRGFARK